ncbi:ABC transporter permease [Brevibacterium sp. SMBL_HHYL_HB1]|uniref:ABC transporter permease n=1 Tax=Brevibacterium sp. SMBL_HHYL_HB1 TaxID=2777556 RepID=UPI001BA5D205|nr:ABC transporter permease [Brevibacterium sp. SMBL_HHYL_HB1]QUL80667.1 ABC transporter permease [Brevibacterium sp. SMBL_HHYL_HB1]
MKRVSLKFLRSLTIVRAVALIFVVALVIMSFVSVWLPSFDPYTQNVTNRFAGLGESGYLLGSDEVGRDVFARLLQGISVELIIAVSATTLAMMGGTLLGLFSGVYPRLGELLLMRVVDVILSFPPVIIALLATTIYGHSNITLTLVLSFLFVPNFGRVVYGQVLSVAPLEYVDASRVFGAGMLTRIFTVILPNCLAPIIVQFTVIIAAAILLESGLSFLGLGVAPPDPSLGAMVATAQRYMGAHPEQLLIPGAVLSLMILSFGILGDFLRDLLDPRT